MFIRIINKLLQKTSFAFTLKKTGLANDMLTGDPAFARIYEQCKPYSMTSAERMYALYKSVEYVTRQNIPGDMVECGVWKGGSAMLIAQTLLYFGDQTRKIFLYDTYEGMTEPEVSDVRITHPEKTVVTEWLSQNKPDHNAWAYASLMEVTRNLASTGYPADNLFYIKGKVEETIPTNVPEHICILRLDTDWERSTKHELDHLFPRLQKNGILIIDDYGHWAGAKKAVDEYMEIHPHFLSRIDATGRLCVKQ